MHNIKSLELYCVKFFSVRILHAVAVNNFITNSDVTTLIYKISKLNKALMAQQLDKVECDKACLYN